LRPEIEAEPRELESEPLELESEPLGTLTESVGIERLPVVKDNKPPLDMETLPDEIAALGAVSVIALCEESKILKVQATDPELRKPKLLTCSHGYIDGNIPPEELKPVGARADPVWDLEDSDPPAKEPLMPEGKLIEPVKVPVPEIIEPMLDPLISEKNETGEISD
jgi:hypothetical protein